MRVQALVPEATGEAFDKHISCGLHGGVITQ
jgi:hypothetical protein